MSDVEKLGRMLENQSLETAKAINRAQRAEVRLEAMARERLIILSRFYGLAPSIVGALCDEVLDQSGALLGEVRKVAAQNNES